MSSRDDRAWVKNLQDQMHVWSAATTRLIDVMEQIIDLLKHPVETPQVPPAHKSSICFGVPGPNPLVGAHPERRPSGFTRHDGPKFLDNHHSSGVPGPQGRQKQPIYNQVSTWKERQFTRLPAPMSMIWPILLKKGLIQREKEFPWIENTRNFDPDKFYDFHCGRRGHSLEECITLRSRVQDIIDTGDLMFRAWEYCGGERDMLVVPSMRLEHPDLVKDACNKEVWDTLGQPSGKRDYMVKYSAPPSFYTNPRDIIPDGWGGMDEVQNPRPSNWVYKGSFIGAIEDRSSKGKSIGPRE